MKIENVVLDFDGTCTQIPVIYKAYTSQYLDELNKLLTGVLQRTGAGTFQPFTEMEWEQAQRVVRERSPFAGWTLAVTSAAPAAADPYILAYESAKFILRNRKFGDLEPPSDAHKNASNAQEAPWRPEARAVFEKLLGKGIRLFFISNSSSTTVTRRLKELFAADSLPAGIRVQSDAAKFRISELPLHQPDSGSAVAAGDLARFKTLPAVHPVSADDRPVYIRRGSYFSAICATVGGDGSSMAKTVFCGDIWEMDLAMPYALGANVHLIDRAEPFSTYPYERQALETCGARGRGSVDLNGLLDWL